MKQERPHHYDSAATGNALDLPMSLAQSRRRVRRQPTMPMRPGYDAQRTTLGAAVIEMRAHGDERLQHRHGRLHINYAVLFGPTCALGMRDPLLDWNTEILV